MDPLSAVSIASNVIQFVDFACKLVSGSRQLHKSLDGVLSDKVIVEVLADDLESLSTNLRKSLGDNQPVGSTRQVYSEDDVVLELAGLFSMSLTHEFLDWVSSPCSLLTTESRKSSLPSV
jgi:hypothetical protein